MGTLAHMGAEMLAKKSGMLTVNQMTVYATLITVKRMLVTGKPSEVVAKLRVTATRHQSMSVIRQSSHRLKMTSEGFLERAAKLWNIIPQDLKAEENYKKYKRRVKSWVKESCPPK